MVNIIINIISIIIIGPPHLGKKGSYDFTTVSMSVGK